MEEERMGQQSSDDLPEGAELVPDEVQEALQHEFNSRNAALMEAIIDRSIADPAWKKKLLSDPQAAFDEAGLLPEVDALNPHLGFSADVTGQLDAQIGSTRYVWVCYTWYGCWSWSYTQSKRYMHQG